MKKILLAALLFATSFLGYSQKVTLSLNGEITNLPDTLYWVWTGQSNWEVQSVGSDTTNYNQDWGIDNMIQWDSANTWVVANLYYKSIQGAGTLNVARESPIVVAAKKYRREHPNTLIRIISFGRSNTSISWWTPKQTGFGEKSDTSNLMWRTFKAYLVGAPARTNITAIFWQQGEKNEQDTTLNSYWYNMKEIEDSVKAYPCVSSKLRMFFSQPTTTYQKLRAAQDSVDFGLIEMSGRDWTIVRNNYPGGVDASHFNNSESYGNGISLGAAVLTVARRTNSNPYFYISADTAAFIKFGTGTFAVSNTKITAGKDFYGIAGNFTGELVSTNRVRGYTSSTTGGQVLSSMFSGTANNFTSFRGTGFSAGSVLGELQLILESTGGGYALAYSTNNSTFARSIYGDHNGRVAIGPAATTPDASCALDLVSTAGGFGLPVMTSTQASAIASPRNGLVVYVTDTNGTFTAIGVWARVNGTWVQL